jgi:hypothetical protein
MNSSQPTARATHTPHVETNSQKNGEFKFDINSKVNEKLQEGLQGGVDALQNFFTGFVKSIQTAIGPEVMRSLSASQWLGQVAASLEEVAAAWRADSPTPPGKSGELSCYAERVIEEVKGSRVEGQSEALCEWLEIAMQAIDREDTQSRSVADAAGYFNAAAKSAMPLQLNGNR